VEEEEEEAQDFSLSTFFLRKILVFIMYYTIN